MVSPVLPFRKRRVSVSLVGVLGSTWVLWRRAKREGGMRDLRVGRAQWRPMFQSRGRAVGEVSRS